MDALLVLGTLAAPQFAAAIEVPLEAAGVDITSTAQERAMAIPTVVGLIAASAIVGVAWNRRIWCTAAACFYVPYTLLFTAFLTDIDGFGSGIWESLDYWLAQHEVQRANQPEFYYLMFWPAYEYLALLLAGPALLYFTLRGGPSSWLLTAIAVVALLFSFGADSFANSRRHRGRAGRVAACRGGRRCFSLCAVRCSSDSLCSGPWLASWPIRSSAKGCRGLACISRCR